MRSSPWSGCGTRKWARAPGKRKQEKERAELETNDVRAAVKAAFIKTKIAAARKRRETRVKAVGVVKKRRCGCAAKGGTRPGHPSAGKKRQVARGITFQSIKHGKRAGRGGHGIDASKLGHLVALPGVYRSFLNMKTRARSSGRYVRKRETKQKTKQ